MKKCICLLLTLVLLSSNFASVHATDYSSNDNVATLTDSRYGFSYTEYVDENNQTIRTYKKQQSVARSSAGSSELGRADALSQDATKALLASLGMEVGFINKLSSEELQEYADSEEIYAVSSYTKTDVDGNITTVSKNEAMNALNSRAVVPTPDPGGYVNTYETSFTDTYMYISYFVYYLGNGQYKFSVDSQWLTMPFFRGYDSLGACAQNMTVENNTRSGWRSYTFTESILGTKTVEEISENLVSGTNYVTFSNVTNGNWYGSAAVFLLPADTNTTEYSWTRYTNYRVHYEYTGTVNYPNLQMNFNTTASYCHTRIALNPGISVTISTSGSSAAVSVNTELAKDIRTAEFDTSIQYIP